MAIKIERSRYQSQPIQVVKYGDMASSANQIANAWGNISSTFFKEAANVAQEKGEEEARKLTNQQLKFYNEDTNSFENLQAPKHFGSIGARAYENLARKRFYQSIDNDFKAKSSELFALHSQKPNGAGIIESEFQNYIASIHKNAGDDNEYANYVKEVGVAYLGNVSTRMLQVQVAQQKDLNLESFKQELDDANIAIVNAPIWNPKDFGKDDPRYAQTREGIIEGLNIHADNLGNAYGDFNSEKVKLDFKKGLILTNNVQRLKIAYYETNNSSVQDEVNQTLNTRNIAPLRKLLEDNTISQELFDSVNEILKSNPSADNLTSIRGTIANITSDINNLNATQIEEISSFLNDYTNDKLGQLENDLLDSDTGVDFKSIAEKYITNTDDLIDYLSINTNFNNLSPTKQAGVINAYKTQLQTKLVDSWVYGLSGTSKTDLKQASLYMEGVINEIQLESRATGGTITSKSIGKLKALKESLNSIEGEISTESAASKLNGIASTIESVSGSTAQIEIETRAALGNLDGGNKKDREHIDKIISVNIGMPQSTLPNVYRNPVSLGGELRQSLLDSIEKNNILPEFLKVNFSMFGTKDMTQRDSNNNVIVTNEEAHDTIAQWWRIISNGKYSHTLSQLFPNTGNKAQAQARLDWFSMVAETKSKDLTESERTKHISDSLEMLRTRNDEGYLSTLGAKIEIEDISPNRQQIDNALENLIVKDLGAFLGNSAVPPVYMVKYATAYAEFLMMHDRNDSNTTPKGYLDVRGQMLKVFSGKIDKAAHIIKYPETAGKFHLMSNGLTQAIGVEPAKRMLAEIEQIVIKANPNLEGVEFDSLDNWQGFDRWAEDFDFDTIGLGDQHMLWALRTLTAPYEVMKDPLNAGRIIQFYSGEVMKGVMGGISGLFADIPKGQDRPHKKHFILEPVDTGNSNDLYYRVLLRKSYETGTIEDIPLTVSRGETEVEQFDIVFNARQFRDIHKPKPFNDIINQGIAIEQSFNVPTADVGYQTFGQN